MDMATKNDTLPAPIGPAAEAMAVRIAAERERLAAEEQQERELIARRKAMIADASDEEIDDVDNKIGSSRSKQLRIIERIDVLGEQLLEANEVHLAAGLDARTAFGERAKQIGESLIQNDYVRHARALADVLRKLAATERIVEDVNRALQKAGRKTIAQANAVRCRPAKHVAKTIKKRVGIGEREHPNFESDYIPGNNGFVTLRQGGKQVPVYVEVDVEVSEFQVGDVPDSLTELVLPGIGPAPAGQSIVPLWNGSRSEIDADTLQAIEAEINGGTLSKITRAASRLVGGTK